MKLLYLAKKLRRLLVKFNNIEFYIDWKYTNTNHETVELMHGFDQ